MAKVKTNLKRKRRTYFRQWRKFRGLTLERLAERLDVTAGALSQLERGDVNYTQPMLEAYAEAVGCDPADLITRDPKEQKRLELVWQAIPVEERDRAIEVLKAFARTGTDG